MINVKVKLFTRDECLKMEQTLFPHIMDEPRLLYYLPDEYFGALVRVSSVDQYGATANTKLGHYIIPNQFIEKVILNESNTNNEGEK